MIVVLTILFLTLWYIVGVYSSIRLILDEHEDVTLLCLLLCLTIGGLFGSFLMIKKLAYKCIPFFNMVIIKGKN
jgi:hypothetical protein